MGERLEARSRFAAETYGFALVVCYNAQRGKWLAVKEVPRKGSTWWLPGGGVDKGEDFRTAAVRETAEEAGVDVRLTGVLRVEYTPFGQCALLRVIFFAEPVDPFVQPKQFADKESECAQWLSELELLQLPPRGPELLEWIQYLNAGYPIMPLSVLERGAKTPLATSEHSLRDGMFYLGACIRAPAVQSMMVHHTCDTPSASSRLLALLLRAPELRSDPHVLEVILNTSPLDRRILQIIFLEPAPVLAARIHGVPIGKYCVIRENWEGAKLLVRMAAFCAFDASELGIDASTIKKILRHK
ncbi:Phosphatase NudJ [Porphyridium purpureum]|uniref:Phosphatase NudJ n=1 Tax=Porphyridium purpureum TaxID=35688 RepID=A0A5J4Z726_PORPP|nr:Phosphatase NudJ [Porphyridium purpureum]|eukprot:POR2349..scf295_1